MNNEKAYEIIKSFPNIKINSGFIILPNDLKEPKELNEALNYMFNEWDYAVLIKSDYEKEFKC